MLGEKTRSRPVRQSSLYLAILSRQELRCHRIISRHATSPSLSKIRNPLVRRCATQSRPVHRYATQSHRACHYVILSLRAAR